VILVWGLTNLVGLNWKVCYAQVSQLGMVNLIYCCSIKAYICCDGFCHFLSIYFNDFIVRKIVKIQQEEKTCLSQP
jgi:hypothetical protein